MLVILTIAMPLMTEADWKCYSTGHTTCTISGWRLETCKCVQSYLRKIVFADNCDLDVMYKDETAVCICGAFCEKKKPDL